MFVPTGRYCGSNRITNPVISNGSRMLVTYITSTRQNGHHGFTANYEGKQKSFSTLKLK